ncbi:MAG: hypothetical protein WDN67_05295 [Candidatus Moraniibacteriota bacterium]
MLFSFMLFLERGSRACDGSAFFSSYPARSWSFLYAAVYYQDLLVHVRYSLFL